MAKPPAKKPKAKAGKRPKLPELNDKERHDRFVDMAHEVDALEEAPNFDESIKKIARQRPLRSGGG